MTPLVLLHSSSHVPIRSWAHDADSDTLRQFQRLASMPYVVEHVAAMADAHMASGVAVGTVFATTDAIIPGALGGDIGCGMSATRLELSCRAGELTRETLQRGLSRLQAAIPVGDAAHRRNVAVPDALMAAPLSTRALERVRSRLAPRHLGTLGGGNHFVELDRDAEGGLWLLVHSGSRGLGGAIAAHHAGATASLDALAPLPFDDGRARAYVLDHTWALQFAQANRARLAERAAQALAGAFDVPIQARPPIDVPHNFVRTEHWLGRDVWVHRKGAAPAHHGQLALVPGSMGTASYLVEGLGASQSFGSCSHGAGRTMSRSEARRQVSLASFEASMRDVVYRGTIEGRGRASRKLDRGGGGALLEEAPRAYRDIRKVVAAQADLIRPVLRLEPLLVLKG